MKIRTALFLLGLAGLVLVIVLNLHQFTGFLKLASRIRWYVVGAVVVIQLASYFINALYYRSIMKVLGHQVAVVRLFEGALAANFVNFIAPTAGMAGAAFLSQVLKPEVPRGQAVLAQILRYALSGLAVLLVMPVALLLVAVNHRAGHTLTRVAITSAISIFVVSCIIVVLIHQESLLRKLVSRLGGRLERFSAKLNRARFERFADEFYAGYHRLIRARMGIAVLVGWSLVYIFVEVTTVYLAFLAFGKAVSFGIPLMGYLLANIASTLGGTLFSTGVYELGMLGAFTAFGVTFVVATSVTIFYRVLNLVIGIPPGFHYYRKYLAR